VKPLPCTADNAETATAVLSSSGSAKEEGDSDFSEFEPRISHDTA